jgi:hypothetical protein
MGEGSNRSCSIRVARNLENALVEFLKFGLAAGCQADPFLEQGEGAFQPVLAGFEFADKRFKALEIVLDP